MFWKMDTISKSYSVLKFLLNRQTLQEQCHVAAPEDAMWNVRNADVTWWSGPWWHGWWCGNWWLDSHADSVCAMTWTNHGMPRGPTMGCHVASRMRAKLVKLRNFLHRDLKRWPFKTNPMTYHYTTWTSLEINWKFSYLRFIPLLIGGKNGGGRAWPHVFRPPKRIL